MSYQLVKAGIAGILTAQGFQESLVCEDFKDSSYQELENTFILNCKEGESNDDSEQLATFLYDDQLWTAQIAFGYSSQSVRAQRDIINIKKDALLAELDDPSNWKTFCTILRYRRWSIEKTEKLFILTIELKVKDAIAY